MEMENISFVNRPKDIVVAGDGGNVPGCMLWILGDDNSVDFDLKGRFEVIDD
jgi:hypothetical protein